MSDDILVRMTAAAHEEVIFHRDADSGLEVIVAIHSTLLGPALGGTRWQPYTNEAAALEDVLRLAEAMTAKSALVGLPFGGGKAVVIGDPDQKRPEALRAYARFIDRLGGRFWTTTDVGTTTAEIDEMRRHTEYVVGTSAAQGGTGDTSELTAVSVVAGMRAAMESTFGTDSFAGRRLVVLGTGKVGSRIARLAANEGAHVVVADVREEVAAALAREIDGETSAAATAHALDCDVLSPNGLGGVLNPASIPEFALSRRVRRGQQPARQRPGGRGAAGFAGDPVRARLRGQLRRCDQRHGGLGGWQRGVRPGAGGGGAGDDRAGDRAGGGRGVHDRGGGGEVGRGAPRSLARAGHEPSNEPSTAFVLDITT